MTPAATNVLVPDEPPADNSCLIENIPRTPNKCVSKQVVFLSLYCIQQWDPGVGPQWIISERKNSSHGICIIA